MCGSVRDRHVRTLRRVHLGNLAVWCTKRSAMSNNVCVRVQKKSSRRQVAKKGALYRPYTLQLCSVGLPSKRENWDADRDRERGTRDGGTGAPAGARSPSPDAAAPPPAPTVHGQPSAVEVGMNS